MKFFPDMWQPFGPQGGGIERRGKKYKTLDYLEYFFGSKYINGVFNTSYVAALWAVRWAQKSGP